MLTSTNCDLQPDHELFERLSDDYSLIRLRGKNLTADPDTGKVNLNDCKKPSEKCTSYQTGKQAFQQIGFRPGENAGIVTGPISNLLVLDVDDEELFQATCIDRGWIVPETFEVTSGKGRHLYFNYPDDGRHFRNIARGELYGIDARGEGGYIVAPGSAHLKRQAMYRIAEDIPKVDPPEWLLDLCEEKKSQDRESRRTQRDEPAQVELLPIELQSLRIPGYIRKLITEGAEVSRRSSAMWWPVKRCLIAIGLTDAQILWVFDKYPIGDKSREKPNPSLWVLWQVEDIRDELDLSKHRTYQPLSEPFTSPIAEHEFASAMGERWRVLGNVVSPALEQTWMQLCRAFNTNIATLILIA